MKKIFNSKGLGKNEIIACLALLIILFAVGMKLFVDNSKNYNSLKVRANEFANAVARYKDQYPEADNRYYLGKVIKKGFIGELKNPMNTSEDCDRYASYVEIEQANNKKIYLTCGNYYVEAVQDKYYKVYERSDWSEERLEGYNDTLTVYNYTRNGIQMLEEYVTDVAFKELYNEREGKRIIDPTDLNSQEGYELLTKTVYRKNELVKEMK